MDSGVYMLENHAEDTARIINVLSGVCNFYMQYGYMRYSKPYNLWNLGKGCEIMEELIAFVVGMSAGIAAYRIYIMYLTGRPGHTVCDYCQFEFKRRELFPKKKK